MGVFDLEKKRDRILNHADSYLDLEIFEGLNSIGFFFSSFTSSLALAITIFLVLGQICSRASQVSLDFGSKVTVNSSMSG